MAKVSQVLNAALSNIMVAGNEAPLEASEYQDAMFAMNNFMLDLDAQGITLGYTEVNDLSDEVTVPAGALRGVIFNVAIESAPQYGGFVSQELIALAVSSLKAMRVLGQKIAQSSYPDTLPIGSGNEDHNIGGSVHFYPQSEAQILAETTGAIGLESNTNKVI